MSFKRICKQGILVISWPWGEKVQRSESEGKVREDEEEENERKRGKDDGDDNKGRKSGF